MSQTRPNNKIPFFNCFSAPSKNTSALLRPGCGWLLTGDSVNEALLRLRVCCVATEIAARLAPAAILISSLLTEWGASPPTTHTHSGIIYRFISQYSHSSHLQSVTHTLEQACLSGNIISATHI